MARGKHSSPQRTKFNKRKKSQVKALTIVKNNETIIKNLK